MKVTVLRDDVGPEGLLHEFVAREDATAASGEQFSQAWLAEVAQSAPRLDTTGLWDDDGSGVE
jgi:hypothetical protein